MLLIALALGGCAKTAPTTDSSPTPTSPTTTSPTSTPEPTPTTLRISGYNSDAVHTLDLATGAIVATTEGVPGAQSVRPDGDGGWLVVAEKVGRVLRLDAGGDVVGTVAEGLDAPTSAVIGPDGDLYVGLFGAGQVLRLDPTTGEQQGVVADGLQGPDAGVVFGPDGTLWVPCFDGRRIVGLDPETGDIVDEHTGVDAPRSLVFDGRDRLWATAWRDDAVVRFGPRGQVTETFAVSRPSGMVLEPSGEALWVIDDQVSVLRRLDAATGDVLTEIDTAALGVDGATFLAWP